MIFSRDGSERADKIPHDFGLIVDGCAPDLVKAHRCVEGIGYRVSRLNIYLADDETMMRRAGIVEEIAVQTTRESSPTHQKRDYHPINVHEVRVSLAEPEIVGAVIIGRLIESDQKTTSIVNMSSVECLTDQRL